VLRVGVGVEDGMSDAVFPRSDLWRGRIWLAVGDINGVGRLNDEFGKGGAEIKYLEYIVGVTVRDKGRLETQAGNTDDGERGQQ